MLAARLSPAASAARHAAAQPRSRLVPQAAAQSAAVGDGGGADADRPCRDVVDIVLKAGKPARRFQRVNQRALNNIITATGAIGFELPNGDISQEVEALPEGGTVHLVLPDDPPLRTQLRKLQRTVDADTMALQQQMAAFLRTLASAEAPGAPQTMLLAAPFSDAYGQHYTQLDAALVAGHTAYVGEFKRVLGESALDDVLAKLGKIRRAVEDDESPDLAAALQGVTHVKLFLGGQAVRAGLAVPELAKKVALAGVSLVLPSGQALGLASELAAAVRL